MDRAGLGWPVGVFVCVRVEIERLGWDLSAGFGYGWIGIKLVNLKCFFLIGFMLVFCCGVRV